MQERSGEAFVIATANDVSSLWWVDLPNQNERVEILAAALRSHGRGDTVPLGNIAQACEGFTGSEIAALVPDALYTAFADGEREILPDDLFEGGGYGCPAVQDDGREDRQTPGVGRRPRPAQQQATRSSPQSKRRACASSIWSRGKKHMKDVTVSLAKVALVFASAMPIALWQAYCLTVIWAWYAPPTLEALSLKAAFGLSLGVGLLRMKARGKQDADLPDIYCLAIVGPAFALAFGWVGTLILT